ncbi:MAG: hypothetical protein GX082_00385 [Clostridiaceae bacterium]|nr:hypothetical protein [Clostridiaceae bacterium]
MDKFRRTAVTAGIFFGFVVFAIAVFFIPPSRALAVGILAAALFALITSLVSDISFKKYRNLDQTIDQDIIHKDIANYYSDRYIRDGLLYLTKDRLIFLFFIKKELHREDILFTNIKHATYGTLFRNIAGLKLFMTDSTVKGFVISDVELFLEYINNVLFSKPIKETENS